MSTVYRTVTDEKSNMKQCDKFIIDNLKYCRQEEGNLTVNFHRIPRNNLSSDTSWPSIFRIGNFFLSLKGFI